MGRPKGSIDYSNIEIPRDKPPTDWTYAERRAEILKLILEAGHPGLVSRTELAKRYGVTPTQITMDINQITEGIREHMGKDADLVTQAVYQKAIKGHLKSDDLKDHKTAADLIKSWNEHLYRAGIRKAAPDQIEHSGNAISISFGSIDAYLSPEELEESDER